MVWRRGRGRVGRSVTSPVTAYHGVRVLVTGGTGFVGRALVDRLAGTGCDLYVGARRPDAARDIFSGLGAPIRVLDLSADRPASIRRAVNEARPALLFNLAGYGVSPSERDPREASLVNAEFPVLLAREIASIDPGSWRGARLVHTGSALEYGTASGDLREDTTPRPTTLYGRTKLEGWLGLRDLGMPAISARLFSVYGPGERAGRLLPALIEGATTGRHLPVTEGGQRRDFTFVDDVAEGLLRLGLVGQTSCVVNLATGRLDTVRSFIQTAVEALSMDPELIGWGELETRREEMRHDPVNVDRLAGLLDWRPPTTLRAGIEQTAAIALGRAPR